MVLAAASVTDIRKREFPVYDQIPLLLLYPIAFRLTDMWGIFLALPFWIAGAADGQTMGGGDVKAVALLGGLLGFFRALPVVMLACTIFIIAGKVIERHRKQKGISLPFIPFLTLGCAIVIFTEVLY